MPVLYSMPCDCWWRRHPLRELVRASFRYYPIYIFIIHLTICSSLLVILTKQPFILYEDIIRDDRKTFSASTMFMFIIYIVFIYICVCFSKVFIRTRKYFCKSAIEQRAGIMVPRIKLSLKLCELFINAVLPKKTMKKILFYYGYCGVVNFNISIELTFHWLKWTFIGQSRTCVCLNQKNEIKLNNVSGLNILFQCY